jgi:Holliday junction resolvasome RuvABC DNA-binding subunit
LVLELRDKLGRDDAGDVLPVASTKQMKTRAEAIVALMSLGHSRQSAEKAVLTVFKESSDKEISVEELIKQALRHTT